MSTEISAKALTVNYAVSHPYYSPSEGVWKEASIRLEINFTNKSYAIKPQRRNEFGFINGTVEKIEMHKAVINAMKLAVELAEFQLTGSKDGDIKFSWGK